MQQGRQGYTAKKQATVDKSIKNALTPILYLYIVCVYYVYIATCSN